MGSLPPLRYGHADSAPLSFDFVLRFRIRNRLPLHVARIVRATAGQRLNVVHDMPRPPVRMASLSHEIVLCLRAALYAAAGVSTAGRG